MLVPQYWAEGRAQTSDGPNRLVAHRFGWSDLSEADAQANANARAADALSRMLAGEKLDRRERKVPYNGADGLPIREEIVRRYGDTIITRNSYGCLCLNTPDVLFADIDHGQEARHLAGCAVFVALASVAVVAGLWAWSLLLGIGLGVVAVVAASWVAEAIERKKRRRLAGEAEGVALSGLRRFVDRHPEWSLRVYRTPAGLRVLVTHRTFDPHEGAVAEFFAHVGADPVYVRMCLNQRCFRARVSPKPWRIGVESHIRPRPGVWPVDPARRAERQAWIEEYEAVAWSFASCELLTVLGEERVAPAVAPVMRLHDEMCRAGSGLPIA